jgi:hypothetical protein
MTFVAANDADEPMLQDTVLFLESANLTGVGRLARCAESSKRSR